SARVVAEDPAPALSIGAGGLRLRVGPRTLNPTVVWVRHFSARAMASTGSPRVDLFREESWRALLGQLECTALGFGPGLLHQLAPARRLGIRVPCTVVTTRPATDAADLGSPRLVVKALDRHVVEAAPGRLSGVFAQVVSRAEAASWPATGF